jgi:hypothetical protein
MYDQDYVNYKLKKTFEDVWGSNATASPGPTAPAAPSASADKK